MNMMATSRIEPGWLLTSSCPSGFRAKAPGSGSVNTPTPASVRNSRRSDGAARRFGRPGRQPTRDCHEVIGDAQSRSDVQSLGDTEAAQQQNHLRRRWKLVSHNGSPQVRPQDYE